MFAVSSSPTWRNFLITVAAAGAFGLVLLAAPSDAQTATEKETTVAPRETTTTAIRPFHVHVPDEALVDLRRRINATKWPERETVTDASQGVQLATIQALARYWATDYDWRKCEATLNALPQFITEIDGLDIHFIHVRSTHDNALPLIVTHGWPGSIIEQLKIIDPLTDPTAHGGKRIGRVRSGDSVDAGLRVFRQADHDRLGPRSASHVPGIVLMKRLGYTRYVAQGGDWGAVIRSRWPCRRLRNCSASTPTGLSARRRFRRRCKALNNGEPPPAGLTARNGRCSTRPWTFYKHGLGYAAMMGTRPQTLGYGIADSPVGLAAWLL